MDNPTRRSFSSKLASVRGGTERILRDVFQQSARVASPGSIWFRQIFVKLGKEKDRAKTRAFMRFTSGFEPG